MPFVEKDHRDPQHVPCCVGDQCYWQYKEFIDQWRKERRWTTAHNITKEFFHLKDDEETAKFLAWMVFFCKEVMAYEFEKEMTNGGI